MRDFDLTILTPPTFATRNPIMRAVRALRALGRGTDIPTLGGHYGVTRSLRDGLRSVGTGLRWRLVTRLDNQSSEVVHVLAGQEQLAEAAKAKSNGLCARLLAGPNMVMWPEQEPLLSSAAVDCVIVPSQWVLDAYDARVPGIGAKCAVWAAGVDTEFWKPTGAARKDVTVFNKGRDDDARKVCEVVTSAGYHPRFLSYGSHRAAQYRAALDRSFACVVVGKSESQGLAIAEAWSMDVPTLVARFDVLFGSIPCSAAPYMDANTGTFWSEISELPTLLSKVDAFSPRSQVLKEHSDEVSARQLLDAAALI